MTVSSMTGFARTDGAAEGFGWTWELRSVNGQVEYVIRDALRKEGRLPKPKPGQDTN